MITLTRKLKKDASGASASSSGDGSKRVSIRDRLLVKEVQEMEQNMPSTCKVFFADANVLSEFTLIITPDEGFWKDGKFKFVAVVPEEYNMTVRVHLKLIKGFWFMIISIQIVATAGEMRHEAMASKHLGDRRHLFVAASPELDRRTGLGADSTPQGRHLGSQLAVYRK